MPSEKELISKKSWFVSLPISFHPTRMIKTGFTQVKLSNKKTVTPNRGFNKTGMEEMYNTSNRFAMKKHMKKIQINQNKTMREKRMVQKD